MSKKNITYIKPEEPSFLRKLKEQIGYKEGPTVDTKRENLGPVDEDNLVDIEEEQPTVVVLNPGDLTAEEAAKAEKDLQKEIEDTPADLRLPVVFKVPQSSKSRDSENKAKRTSTSTEHKKSKKVKSKIILSFDEEDAD